MMVFSWPVAVACELEKDSDENDLIEEG